MCRQNGGYKALGAGFFFLTKTLTTQKREINRIGPVAISKSIFFSLELSAGRTEDYKIILLFI
jgi:hypothetical protein